MFLTVHILLMLVIMLFFISKVTIQNQPSPLFGITLTRILKIMLPVILSIEDQKTFNLTNNEPCADLNELGAGSLLTSDHIQTKMHRATNDMSKNAKHSANDFCRHGELIY